MKHALSIVLLCSIVYTNSLAQDEGSVVVRDRFTRDKSVYLSVGPSFTLGKNLGDYSAGFSLEAGFLKKSNKLVSWGANLSYLTFGYDQDKTYKYYYDPNNDIAIEASLSGGDVSLISLGASLKLHFIPVGDNSKITVYGVVNPFVSYVMRKDVIAAGDVYIDEDGDGVYSDFNGRAQFTPTDYPALAAENKVSGGAHLGLGVELFPASKISGFIQATFSYTLPVSYIATGSFLKDEDKYQDTNGRIYYDANQSFYKDEYPINEKGFSALSLKVGVSYNF